MSSEGLKKLPSAHIPQPDLLPMPDDEKMSIRAETHHARDTTRTDGENSSEFSRSNIPQMNGFVTPTCECVSVRAEIHAVDPAREQGDFLVGLRIIEPHTDRTRNSEQLTIRRIRDVIYITLTEAQFRTFG